VLNNSGSYTNCGLLNGRFKYHTADSKTLHYRVDSQPINPANPITATGIHEGRNNIIFNICAGPYTLNPNNIIGIGANITLVPNPIPYGGNGTAYFSSTDKCGTITDVIIDGEHYGVIDSYEFINVTAPLPIIEVVIDEIKYSITAVAHPNGFIDPQGITEINCEENIIYTIIPNEDYEISFVLVNGSNMGAIDTYTFASVVADGTIEAFFSPKNFIKEQFIEGINIYCHANIIYITNENYLSINDITIFDMFGRTIWQGFPQKQPIVLDVANGIYAVRITANNQVSITKVSIQK